MADATVTLPSVRLLTVKTREPKLSFLKARLTERGIPYRQEGVNKPILKVATDRYLDALDVLDVMYEIDGEMVELDCIPNNHPMFSK